MPKDKVPASATARFLKLGGLMGQVGVSVAADRALGVAPHSETALPGPLRQRPKMLSFMRTTTPETCCSVRCEYRLTMASVLYPNTLVISASLAPLIARLEATRDSQLEVPVPES